MDDLSARLSENDLLSIEKINDLFVDDSDDDIRIHKALDMVLGQMGYSAGTVYLCQGNHSGGEIWIRHNMSMALMRQLDDATHSIHALIAEAAISAKARLDVNHLGFAAIFPLQSISGRVLAVLVVWGSPVPVRTSNVWAAYLRPLARLIEYQTVSSASRIKAVLHDLETSQGEILNSRNTFRRMFDSLPLSVYIVDHNHVVKAINATRSQRVGVHQRYLVGKRCYEQLFNRSDPCPHCRIMETFETGLTTQRSSREWADLDAFTEWKIYTHLVQNLDPQLMQVIVVEEDVTEKRNLESNMIQSEKLAAFGHLAAGVVHEINNPLAAIIANAQLLKKELPKDKQDWIDSIKLIEMAGVRAAAIVTNLMGIAHKDTCAPFERISLNESIEIALSLFHHEITYRSIDVKLDLQPDMPAILASRNNLQGVWINLLANCLDASDKSNGVISVSTRYDSHLFRIVIADNGKGISQEHLSRLFTPFFTTKMVGRGTGLGLTVSQRVIKEHQGDIHVESQVGQGTAVTVCFRTEHDG